MYVCMYVCMYFSIHLFIFAVSGTSVRTIGVRPTVEACLAASCDGLNSLWDSCPSEAIGVGLWCRFALDLPMYCSSFVGLCNKYRNQETMPNPKRYYIGRCRAVLLLMMQVLHALTFLLRILPELRGLRIEARAGFTSSTVGFRICLGQHTQLKGWGPFCGYKSPTPWDLD